MNRLREENDSVPVEMAAAVAVESMEAEAAAAESVVVLVEAVKAC